MPNLTMALAAGYCCRFHSASLNVIDDGSDAMASALSPPTITQPVPAKPHMERIAGRRGSERGARGGGRPRRTQERGGARGRRRAEGARRETHREREPT